MADNSRFPENDPRHHTGKLTAMLLAAAEHARQDVGKADDP
jgi:hypothetical protein